jgi:acetylornithine/succinyldiaminopimelate/putrescine aminotransferase
VQGEGGINAATPEFLKGLRALCDRHDLLLMFDEVQCGFGRTGDWCAWRTIIPSGVEPDAVSWAKGIAGGVPLGAFWAGTRKAGSEPICDLLGPGTHGTTYGGNPLAATTGLAVLNEIGRAGLLTNARELGSYLMRELEVMGIPAIRLVRGVGLMIGIELNDLPTSFGGEGHPSIRATKVLMAAGLLVIPSGERTIRLLPPLNITREEADEALAILKGALSS